jgi:hypothetical protein
MGGEMKIVRAEVKPNSRLTLWLWIAVLALSLVLLVHSAMASDVTSTSGATYSNGEVLLTAGVRDPIPAGTSLPMLVCWRMEGGAELGCVGRSSFVVVGNDAFQVNGSLVTITAKQPASAFDVNFVAFKRLALPTGIARIRARTVSEQGVETESPDALVFNIAPPPPPAPAAPVILQILIDNIQSALDQARDQLAQVTGQ